jgi:hypothetical protein
VKVRVKIRDKATGELLDELDDEGTDYAVVRDSIFARIPDGWQAISIAVDRPETFV